MLVNSFFWLAMPLIVTHFKVRLPSFVTRNELHLCLCRIQMKVLCPAIRAEKL